MRKSFPFLLGLLIVMSTGWKLAQAEDNVIAAGAFVGNFFGRAFGGAVIGGILAISCAGALFFVLRNATDSV